MAPFFCYRGFENRGVERLLHADVLVFVAVAAWVKDVPFETVVGEY